MIPQFKVRKVHPNAQIPIRKPGDVGYDVYATQVEETEQYVIVHSGLAFEAPEGWCLFAYPRSSSYKKGITLTNSVGIIDNSYRGEVTAVFQKNADYSPVKIGDRFIQLVPQRYDSADFLEVSELSSTSRGTGGYGSTGR